MLDCSNPITQSKRLPPECGHREASPLKRGHGPVIIDQGTDTTRQPENNQEIDTTCKPAVLWVQRLRRRLCYDEAGREAGAGGARPAARLREDMAGASEGQEGS